MVEKLLYNTESSSYALIEKINELIDDLDYWKDAILKLQEQVINLAKKINEGE